MTHTETRRSFDLGPYICANPHHALLHHVLGEWHGHYSMDEQPIINREGGIAVEFGVGNGDSLRCIARYLPVIGFDSFEGLPEDWRPGFDKGSFAYDYEEVFTNSPSNTKLVRGLFEEILPTFSWAGPFPIKLVHIDCDLYSSTKTVLENLPWRKLIQSNAVILFDEFWGYPGAEDHEQRAWHEFTSQEPWDHLEWEVIGHGIQQWSIRLV